MKSKRRKGQIPKPNPSAASLFVLDQFSHSELRKWLAVAKDAANFEYLEFYCLEAQRAARYEELCNTLRSAGNAALSFSSWIRIVSYRHSLHPLSAKGSLKWTGGRFNYGARVDSLRFTPFPALYFAEDRETAWCERFGIGVKTHKSGLTREELALTDAESLTIVQVKGEVNNLFDLCDLKKLEGFAKIIRTFDTSKEVRDLARRLELPPPRLLRTAKALRSSLLEDNWRFRPAQFDVPANCQIFGKLLQDAGFEGVIYPSTKGAGKCLAVFIQNFAGSSSFIEIVGQAPSEEVPVRLDAGNWKRFV